jgi:flavin-dependent dehydrogenase
MESGRYAADAVVQALARPEGASRENALAAYPARLSEEWGAYYRLGGLFVKLIGHPAVMRFGTHHGLHHPMLMRFVLKLLANLTDPHDGDVSDRIITTLQRLTPPVR